MVIVCVYELWIAAWLESYFEQISEGTQVTTVHCFKYVEYNTRVCGNVSRTDSDGPKCAIHHYVAGIISSTDLDRPKCAMKHFIAGIQLSPNRYNQTIVIHIHNVEIVLFPNRNELFEILIYNYPEYEIW